MGRWILRLVRAGAKWACIAWVVVLAHAATRPGFKDKDKLQFLIGIIYTVHLTFWYNSIPTAVWLKDMKYNGNKPRSPFFEPTFQSKPWDDHVAQVCRLNMYLKFAEEVHAGVVMSPITDRRVTLPPEERAEAYLEACREVVARLPEEQRRILETLNPVPPPWQFYLNLTHPWINGRFTKSQWKGLDDLMLRAPGREFPDGKDAEWSAERELQAAGLPSLDGRRKPEEELRDLPAEFLEGLRQLDIRPVRDEHIDVEEIPRALREGRTAVFDATKLCGKDVFNLTIPDIARLEGSMAKDIPVFKLQSAGIGDGTYDSLEEAGQRFQTWSGMGWQDFPDYRPFRDQAEVTAYERATIASDWLTTAMDALLAWYLNGSRKEVRFAMQNVIKEYRQKMTQLTINVRRLQHFPLQDMRKAMGSPGWVDRLWNLLWIGPVPDFWHFDEEDNLLIAISGTMYVAVMEQNYTDLVSGTRNVGLGFNNLEGFFKHRVPGQPHWLDYNSWVRKVPIHFMKLKPGMGITVPSRTYHNVMTSDSNRILMNCFFFPKWRAAEDAPAIANSWFKPGTQADTFRAMWHLKAATLWHLWDTKRVGGFFAGYKLEFF